MKKKKQKEEGIFLFMPVLKIAMPFVRTWFSLGFGGGFNFYLLFYCSFIFNIQCGVVWSEVEGKGILVRLNWMISNKSQIVIVGERTQ